MTKPKPPRPVPTHRPATLDRWEHERVNRHQGLLLFAMQAEGMRSKRATSRAMGMSETGLRGWYVKNDWADRILGQGEGAAQYALDLYRTLYMIDFGPTQLPWVSKNVVNPIGHLDINDPAGTAQHLMQERTRKAANIVQAEVQQQSAILSATKQSDDKLVARRHRALVDGALGVIAKRLKKGDIRVSVRDIPILIECRDKLTRMASETAAGAGAAFVESARVKYARETGGDLLQAMHEDAEECVIILGALRGRQGVDMHALAKENEELSDEAALA